jgi:hypothetical protein
MARTPAEKAEERAREAERGIADEAQRLSSLHARTKRLRALREARDAAMREEEQARKQGKGKPSRPK